MAGHLDDEIAKQADQVGRFDPDQPTLVVGLPARGRCSLARPSYERECEDKAADDKEEVDAEVAAVGSGHDGGDVGGGHPVVSCLDAGDPSAGWKVDRDEVVEDDGGDRDKAESVDLVEQLA